MTTRVKLECPDNSHWYVKVTAEDKVWDADKKGWAVNEIGDPLWSRHAERAVVLKQGDKHETYIHDSRRLVVEEIVPESAN